MTTARDLQLLQLNILCAVSSADRLAQGHPTDPHLQRLCLHLYDALEMLETQTGDDDGENLDRAAD